MLLLPSFRAASYISGQKLVRYVIMERDILNVSIVSYFLSVDIHPDNKKGRPFLQPKFINQGHGLFVTFILSAPPWV